MNQGIEYAYLITTLAALISEDRTADELAFLGALITQLGDTLVAISLTKI